MGGPEMARFGHELPAVAAGDGRCDSGTVHAQHDDAEEARRRERRLRRHSPKLPEH